AAGYAHRDSEVTYPVASPQINQYEWAFAPRLGMTYQLKESVQWFANLSRSIEPAHPWAMAWSYPYSFDVGIGSRRVLALIQLKTQTANILELGGRGQSGFGDWALSYYYSKVKNELLTSELIKTYEDGSNRPSEPIAVESNATPTTHQGI